MFYSVRRKRDVAGRLSVLVERKIIVTKLNTVLLACLVSAGLLTIGADSAFAAVNYPQVALA